MFTNTMQVANSRVEEIIRELSVLALHGNETSTQQNTAIFEKFTFKCLSHDLSFDKERESLPKNILQSNLG